MPGLDDSRQFVPLKIAVLTVSDTRNIADDKSGGTLAERIEKAGHAVAARAIVPRSCPSALADDRRPLRAALGKARY